jgi:hypothetical protein
MAPPGHARSGDDGGEPGGAPAGSPQTGGPRGPWRGRRPSWPALLLAALAYLPLLATAPGRIGADTKAYLYLDPARMLSRAVSMWDPHVGAGTVTHQTIGYLFPQGLFYWLLDAAGLPDWAAQRLWTASILFAAGAGVLFLLRSFPWPRAGGAAGTAGTGAAAGRGPGWPDRYAFVAAAGYMLTPYVLEYEARISAILLPYAGLGWLVGVTVRGLREAEPGRAGWRLAGWRHPILFALTVTTIGSINASSLIFILLAPLLWVPFAVWGTREVGLGAAAGMCVRAVIVILFTSAWWIAGLYTQAGYGLNVLAFTETVKTVASSSQASEVLRGLGNWFFYGEDALGPWISPAQGYTRTLWLIAVSFTLPVLALAAAGCLRWGQRAYFVCLLLLGTTVAVGVYPYDDPSPLGRLFRDFAEGSTAGLALRSLPRAVPMAVLGLSVLLAAGLAALVESRAAAGARDAARAGAAGGPSAGTAGAGRGTHRAGARRRRRRLSVAAFAAVLGLIALDAAPLFRGQYVEDRLDRPERVPDYELAAARALDAGDPATRVLELPGADFAHYRWGATLDPVTTGLTDRAHLVRELIPYGEAGTVDLLRALDRRLQEGVLDAEAVPDVARLLGVGDVLLRNNIQYERFRSPRPRAAWDLFTADRPAGLSAPRPFGPGVAEDHPVIPFTDEITLGTADVPEPPSLAVFGVADPVPIVRAATADAPLLVDGSGEALVDAAATGVLGDVVDGSRLVVYSASTANDPQALQAALARGATLLVSDTNRRRAQRWTGVRENFGHVEQVGVEPLERDPNDNRLPLFPAAGDDDAYQTVAVLHAPGSAPDVEAVRASGYGNSFAYGPSDRPVRGIDGDVATAWRVGAFTDPVGERWQASLAKPTTADHVRLVQPVTGPRNRWITTATLRFDAGSPVTVALGEDSRTPGGQVVTFPRRTFRRLDITVDATNSGRRKTYDGLSAVGFAEVEIPGEQGRPLVADEILRLPTHLLDAAGASSLDHPLAVQLSRDRANPAEPFKSDTESELARTFELPAGRSFDLTGTARISAYAPDGVVDAILGRPTAADATADATAGAAPGPGTPGAAAAGTATAAARSSARLPGDLESGGAAAFDGDRATHWSPGLGRQEGGWVEAASLRGPATFSSLRLSVLADGRHSVPTRVGLVVDGRRVRTLAVPRIEDGGVHDVAMTFPPVRGSTVRLVLDEVDDTTTTDSISGGDLALPVAIAEVDVAGLRTAPPPAQIPSPCRDDLLTVDGHPVGLQVTGGSGDAIERRGLGIHGCGGPLTLGPGPHVVRTADGEDTGIDVDRLLFSSGRGGVPAAAAPGTQTTGTQTTGAPSPGTHASGTRAGRTPPGVPALTVDRAGDTSYTVRVAGAKPGVPFWLVLGQSLSPGWTATAAGRDAGAPVLVDGYANGWQIVPTAASFTVELRWTPQRTVWAALAVSAVAVAASLTVLAVLRRRRRRSPASRPAGAPEPDLPRWESPWAPGPTPGWRRAAPVALGAAAVGTVLVNPLAGLLVAAAALLGSTTRRGRIVLRLGPAVCLAVSAVYVLEVQARFDLPTTGEWVATFDKVATLSWLAVLLLAADVAVAAVVDRAAPARSDARQP